MEGVQRLMIYLLAVSIIWGFSFGLIKDNLAGIDPNLISFLRLLLSAIIFIPFLKISAIEEKLRIKLFITGAVQYGVMYIFYLQSFKYLQAYEVALFTIFTPLYVSLINDYLRRRFSAKTFTAALITVLGTGIVLFSRITSQQVILGFLFMQVSNICFAFGQMYYKKILSGKNISDKSVFALLYFGAVITALISAAFTVDIGSLDFSLNQLAVIFYLGIASSGIAFFLWNLGVRNTSTGAAAIFNNLKIPIAILISIFFFGETVDLIRLSIGILLILSALFLNEKKFARS